MATLEIEVNIELLDEEHQIDGLANKVQNLISKEEVMSHSLDLIMLHGLLRFKGKLWQGKLAVVDLVANDDGSSEEVVRQENGDSLLTYVVACIGPAERLPRNILSDEIIQSLAYPYSLSMRGVFLIHKSKAGATSVFKQSFKGNERKAFWKKNPLFGAEDSFLRVFFVNKILWEEAKHFYEKQENFFEASLSILTILPNKKDLVPFNIPDGYEVRELEPKDVLYAMQNYKHSSPAGCQMYLQSAKYGLAIGAFPVGSEFPVSWAFCSDTGAISAVTTLENHMKKGLAKAVVSRLSEKIISIDHIPFAFIEKLETAFRPMGMFKSLGFELREDVNLTVAFSMD